VIIFLALPGASFAQSVLLDDAYVSTAPKSTDSNFGTNPNLSLNATANVYIKFKLSPTLPAGTSAATVERATLKLYSANVMTPGKLDVYAVAGPWNEATITGRNAPLSGGLLTTTTQLEQDKRHEFLMIDITALVQQWLGDDGQGTNGIPNYGIVLVGHPVDATTPTVADITFDSKENSQTSHEPQLDIQLNQKGDSGEGSVKSVNADGPLVVTNPTTTPNISLGIVPITKGGTGLNAPGEAGSFLRSDGNGFTSGPLIAPDIPAGSLHYIQNGTGQQAGTSFNIGGTGSANVFDAATQFNIAGNRILSNAGTNNVFAGMNAGANNTTGNANAFIGRNAGQSNSSGASNSFVGDSETLSSATAPA
jgi:hypothetical protein